LTGSIPSGTNAIGKLAANSGVDIGDVDVTSCDGIAAEAAALGNGILIQGDDGTDRKNINVDATTGDVQVDVTNTITETNSATIAGDTTSIDGKITACNTGAVVISSGSVTETNSAAILADTASMDTNLGTVAGAVVAGQMQVDIVADGAGLATAANQSTVIGHLDGVEGSLTDIETNTDFGAVTGGGVEASALRVTLASDSTGTLTVDTTGTAGLEVVQTTAADLNCTEASASGILTAVQIMDDWDAVHDSAASSDGPQLIAAYDSTKPTAVADGDAVRVLSDSYGRLLAGLEPEWFNATYDSSDATAEGATVKAATASKKIYILSCILSSDVEGWIKLQDEDSNALTGKMWLKAGGGMALTWPPEAPLVLNTVNKALEVIAEAAGDVSVTVTGYLAP
jgi:hypothetical protein